MKISYYNTLLFEICARELLERNSRICKKLTHFIRNLLISRINNMRILRIKNAKNYRYNICMNTSM